MITASSHANSAPTEHDPLTLTGEDLAALRLADRVCFYHHAGQNYMLAYLDGGHSASPRIFTGREQRVFPGVDAHNPDRQRRIDCTGSVYGYPPEDNQPNWDHLSNPHVICYEPGAAASYLDTWATLARLLKPSDRLLLRWTADISQGLLQDHGLHRDTLHLVVKRDEQKLTFLLADRVSANHQARMIRP
jgi:hypothetical protein